MNDPILSADYHFAWAQIQKCTVKRFFVIQPDVAPDRRAFRFREPKIVTIEKNHRVAPNYLCKPNILSVNVGGKQYENNWEDAPHMRKLPSINLTKGN